MQPGERVVIHDGCLEGLRGTLIREKDQWRVVVSVEVLQRSVAVEVDREVLTRVKEVHKPIQQRISLLKTG